MLSCCKHCKHTGSHIHERGWSCKYHDVFISLNDLENLKKAFQCKDCELDYDHIFQTGVKCKKVSIDYVLKQPYASTHNGIHIYRKKDGDGLGIANAPEDMVEYYVVSLDGFPVFRSDDIEKIKFIKKGLGLKP